jgi:hypothetical protein
MPKVWPWAGRVPERSSCHPLLPSPVRIPSSRPRSMSRLTRPTSGLSRSGHNVASFCRRASSISSRRVVACAARLADGVCASPAVGPAPARWTRTDQRPTPPTAIGTRVELVTHPVAGQPAAASGPRCAMRCGRNVLREPRSARGTLATRSASVFFQHDTLLYPPRSCTETWRRRVRAPRQPVVSLSPNAVGTAARLDVLGTKPQRTVSMG